MDKKETAKKIKPISIVVFIGVVGFILYSATNLLLNALTGETNMDLIQFVSNPCEPIPMQSSNAMVVLRIDDVQAYAWSDISRQMIIDAHTRDIVPVLGVIPKNIASDQVLFNFLRSVRCNIEVAVHGWDHASETESGPGEFANLSKSQTEEKIVKAEKELEILTRNNVVTFIPPLNEISGDAREYLQDREFIISSEGSDEYDYDATTFDYQTDVFVAVDDVVEECMNSIDESEVCIIMTHPQEFATRDGSLDYEKYTEYISLLDELQSRGVTFVTFQYLQALREN